MLLEADVKAMLTHEKSKQKHLDKLGRFLQDLQLTGSRDMVLEVKAQHEKEGRFFSTFRNLLDSLKRSFGSGEKDN